MPFLCVQAQKINCGFPLFSLLVARLLQSGCSTNISEVLYVENARVGRSGTAGFCLGGGWEGTLDRAVVH